MSVLTLKRTLPHDPDIDAWFAARPGPLGELAFDLFTEIRRIAVDGMEALHDGCPAACVGDAPFVYVNVFRNHLNLGFYQGASLPDPKGLLQGDGKRMRHVSLRSAQEADRPAITALIEAAYADMIRRLTT